MLYFMAQYCRPRPTIQGTMAAVFACGLILGCVIETRRIKRAQACFRQRAADFGQLETGERNLASTFLSQSLNHKKVCEQYTEWIERLRTPGDRSFPNPNNRVINGLEAAIEQSFALGKQRLLDAQEAKSKAENFSILRRAYAEAAKCVWLPFTPSPLPGDLPAAEIRLNPAGRP
jgi:hypothetical protein